MVNAPTPSPGGGPGGKSLVSFCFCSAGFSAGTHKTTKRVHSYSFSRSSEDRESRERAFICSSSLSSIASGGSEESELSTAETGPPAPSAVSGQCHNTHTHCSCVRSYGARTGSLTCSARLPHRELSGCAVNSPRMVSGSLASAYQPVSMGIAHNPPRLQNSIQPAHTQILGHSFHYSESVRCTCTACRTRCPPGKGRDRTGPSNRDELRVLQLVFHSSKEGRWVTTDLGFARSEPISPKTILQNDNAETDISVNTPPRLVCSNRSERHVLSCVHSPSPQTVSALCVRGVGIPIQSTTVRAVSLSPCIYESSGSGVKAPERERCSHFGLPRRLAYNSAFSTDALRAQRLNTSASRPSGSSGQLGKEQTLPYAEDLFSRDGTGLDRFIGTFNRSARPINSDLPWFFPREERGPSQTISEAPGKYGSSRDTARAAPYETASALASRSSPEESVARRHSPCNHYTCVSSNIHPVVRPCVSESRGFHETDLLACCCTHRCIQHGWGATYNGLAASGVWTAPQLHWQINCRELWAVYLGLLRFATELRGKDVLVRTDNTATVAYINRQGGLRSRHMSHLARHLLLWSQKHLRSLRAIHIPGSLNTVADALSRAARPREWRIHPQTVQLIWKKFGRAQIDLFASPDDTHCRLFYSLTEGSLGVDALTHSWPRGMRKYAFPPVSLIAQTLCKVRQDEESLLLVAPYWTTRNWFPELMLLATAPPWRIPLRKDLLSQGGGTLWHPRPDLWDLHVWSLSAHKV
nr:uncharacterized protein LOC129429021 [Misgurnus anguillicaudatus]